MNYQSLLLAQDILIMLFMALSVIGLGSLLILLRKYN